MTTRNVLAIHSDLDADQIAQLRKYCNPEIPSYNFWKPCELSCTKQPTWWPSIMSHSIGQKTIFLKLVINLGVDSNPLTQYRRGFEPVVTIPPGI